MKYHTHKNGYSLVEVLVAVSILLVSIVGPLTIAAKGLQSSYYAREQVTAIFLAQEGMEAFIAARNNMAITELHGGSVPATNWHGVEGLDPECFGFGNSGCNIDFTDNTPLDGLEVCDPVENCRLYFDGASAGRAKYFLNGSAGQESPYVRVIKLEERSPTELEVEVTVSWNATLFKNQEQSVVLTTELFDIY